MSSMDLDKERDKNIKTHQIFRRRDVLRLAGGAGVFALSGCTGDPAGGQITATSTKPTTETAELDRGEMVPSDDPDDYETFEAPQFSQPDRQKDGFDVFEGVPFRKTPSKELKLDLYLPPDSDNVPLFIFVHGGGYESGSRSWNPPWKADIGWAVASIDYRLSTTALYPAAVRDVAAGVTWLRTRGAKAVGIDPTRTVLRGDSAGAHLATLVAVAPNEEQFQPVGLDAHLTNLAGYISMSGSYNLRESTDNKAMEKFFGCSYNQCPEYYKEASPIDYVDESDPRALIWHGGKDPILDYEKAVSYVEALKEADVPVNAILPEDAGHCDPGEGYWRKQQEFLKEAFGFEN